MTHCVSDHLDQFYNVIRLDMRLEFDGVWWSIWAGHRHETGQMGQCQATTFDRLTVGEALDVVSAVVDSLLPPRAPL